MNKYIFPFNSCEIPQINGIAQPYSTSINIVLCTIILLFLLNSNNNYSKLFLFSLLLFNLFHTLSHSIHLENFSNYQFLFTHFSAICSTFILLFMLNHITNKNIESHYLYLLLFLYLFDIFLITINVSHIYNIIIFMIILFFIIIYYYNFLSCNLQQNLIYIILFSLLTLFFQVFEILNCEYILQNYENFPFHIINEISAFIPIVLLCYSFYII